MSWLVNTTAQIHHNNRNHLLELLPAQFHWVAFHSEGVPLEGVSDVDGALNGIEGIIRN